MAKEDGWLYAVSNVGPGFDDDGARFETAIERYERLNGIASTRTLTSDERHILDDALHAAMDEYRQLNPPTPKPVPAPPKKTVQRAPVETKPSVADTPAAQGVPDIKEEDAIDDEARVSRAPTQSVSRNSCGALSRRKDDPLPPEEAAARADPAPADDAELRELLERIARNEPTVDGDPHPTHGYPFSRWPATAADPIDLFTGAFTLSAVDLVVPATPSDIVFERCYRSGPPYYGPFGFGWDHGFNIHLRPLSDGRLALWTGRLREQYFLPEGALSWRCEPQLAATIEPLPSPRDGFLVTHAQGVTWRFERPLGWPRPDRIPLVAIADRYGNEQRLDYDPSGRLHSVLDEAGRGLLFDYGECGLLEQVSDHTGMRSVRFEHHPEAEQLVRVVSPPTGAFPNGIATIYDYDLNAEHPMMRHNLLRISDCDGRLVLENEYAEPDAGWAFNAVIAQRVGNDEFRFDYEQIQWVPPVDDFVNDLATRTTISRPDGTLEFLSFNFRGDLLDHRFRLTRDKTYRVIATERRFDPQGNVTQVIAPDGIRTVYTYETANPDPKARRNLRSVETFAAAPSIPQSRLLQQIFYDPTYQLPIRIIDEAGAETLLRYDFDLGDPAPTGRLKEIIHPTATLPDGMLQPCIERLDHDALGRLAALTSPTGSRTELRYEATGPHRGFLAEIVHDAAGPAPRTTRLGYGPTGFPTFVEEPGGARTDSQVNGLGQVEQVELPLVDGSRAIVRVRLGPTGVPLITELPRGDYAEPGFTDSVIIDRLETDVVGRITGIVAAANTSKSRTTRIVPDYHGQPSAIQDAAGIWTENRFDERGLLVRKRAAAGEAEQAVSTFGYDRAGRLDWLCDPLGCTSRVEQRDDWGRPVKVRLQSGALEELVWGERDVLLERRVTGTSGPGLANRLLARESYGYDERARQTELTIWSFDEDPANAQPLVTTTFYDAEDRPARILLPRGATVTYDHDGLGQLAATSDGLGNRRDFGYDQAGNLEAVTETDLFGTVPRTRTTRFEHDARHRLRRIAGPASAIESDYDERTLLTERREPGGVTTSFAYGPHGELVESLCDPTGLALRSRYQHDERGDVVGFTDPAGEVTRWQRDALGRSEHTILPDGTEAWRSFDAAGRVTHVHRASGTTIRYDYLATGGEPVRATVTTAAGSTPAGPFDYAYDGLERRVLAKDPKSEIVRRFDSLGRLTAEHSVGSTILIHHDDLAGTTELTFPDGRKEKTHFDPDGRPIAVALAAPGSLGGTAGTAICILAYGGPSRPTTIAFGNGTATTLAYDDAGRLMALDVEDAGGAVDSMRYIHDERGRRALVHRLLPARAILHGYDRRDRLRSARWGSPPPFPAPEPSPQQQAAVVQAAAAAAPPPDGERFDLGTSDVRQSHTWFGTGTGVDIYSQLPGGRIGSVNGAPIAYSDDGDRTGDERFAYEADALGRVVAIHDVASNALLTSTSYDALSRPVAGMADGSPYSRWFLGDLPIEERAASAGPARRQWTPHPLWAMPVLTATTSEQGFIHLDGGYSSLCVTDENGQMIERHRMGPFGEPEILDATGAATGLPPRHGLWWRAMPLLPKAGIYRTPRRLYDPETGTFLARDPLLYRSSPNPYAFASQNPVDGFDPTGRDPSSLDDEDWDDEDDNEGAGNRLERPPPTRNDDWFRRYDAPGSPTNPKLVQRPTGFGAAGWGLRYGSPPRFTLAVPDTYDRTKLEAYNRGVLQQRIGKNAGPGVKTKTRRESPVQRRARAEFRRRVLRLNPTSPQGNPNHPDHIIELQHDLWGTSGNEWFDYRPQDGPSNVAEGRESWRLQEKNPFGLPAGGVARASEAGRWYHSLNFRRAQHATGTAMTFYGIYESGRHVESAFYADLQQHTAGQQTIQAVAEEAGGWAAAIAIGTEGAAFGAVCGPLAWVCMPTFGLVGAGVGYYAGSGSVRTTIWSGEVVIDYLAR